MHVRLPGHFATALLFLCAPAVAFESIPGCNSRLWGETKSMVVAPNGDAIVTGCLHGAAYETTLTMRYDGETGALRWSAQYPSSRSGNEGAAAIGIDSAGNVIVAGRSYDGPPSRKKIRVIKYDGESGGQLWTAFFEAAGSSMANAVAVSQAGDVFVTGESSDAGGNRNIRTVKFDAETGVQRWTASYAGSFGNGFDIGQAIAVDSQGDAYVTGLSGETIGGSNLRTIKYHGETGQEIWTHQMGVAGDDSGLDAAVGPDGRLVVIGYTYETTQSKYRIIKYDNDTGSVRWTTTVAGDEPGGDTAEAVAFDPQGNVIVTGLGDLSPYNLRTAKLQADTGAALWKSTYRGAGDGLDAGMAVATDGNGDVFATGYSQESASPATVGSRTIKYRGADGAIVWSVGTEGDRGKAIGVDAQGDVLIASPHFSTVGYGFKVVKYDGATGATRWASAPTLNDQLPGPLSGLWWNPAESGWGIHLTQRRNVLFAAWYAYDSAGKPKWYVAPGCPLPTAGTTGSCSQSLYEVSGPTFFTAPFDPARVQSAVVGSLQLSFTGVDTGSMSYTVAGQSRTVALQRQQLPMGTVSPPIDFTDLWWDPNESGWGLAVTHRYDVMFLAWYVYDASGKPVWLVASNCAVNPARDGCSGPLYRTTGPAFGPSFDPARVEVFPAGTVTLRFYEANGGVLSYTVDGISGTKSVIRQLF